MKTIVVDIDGTLGESTFPHGKYGLSKMEKYMRMRLMVPYPKAIPIVNTLSKFYYIIIATCRDKNYRDITEWWLKKYGFQYYELVMVREWEKYEECIELKTKIHIKIDPILYIEDDWNFIQSMKHNGIDLLGFYIQNEDSWNFCKILKLLEMKERDVM